MSAAEALVEEFTAAGLTVATAESLTAGLVSAGIADVPGASTVLRGGAVTYATECKALVLGVDADLLRERGAVDPDVAKAMAAGAQHLFKSDVAVATTGVAGPTEQDGQPVGTVFVGLAHESQRPTDEAPGESVEQTACCHVRAFLFDGNREEIRRASAEAAWAFCLDVIRGEEAHQCGIVSAGR